MTRSADLQHLHLPLIISESLRSAVAPTVAEGIVSILLSSADLAKLDLSSLELFSVDNIGLRNGRIVDPHWLSSDASAEEHQNRKDATEPASDRSSWQQKFGISEEDVQQRLDAAATDHRLHTREDARQDSFSFHTPLILSPQGDLFPEDLPFPLFKSKAVVEAEKASAEQLTMGDSTNRLRPEGGGKKKAMSMDELTLNQHYKDGFHDFSMQAKDDGGISRLVATQAGQSRPVRRRVPLPALEIARPGLEETAENMNLERILSRVTEEGEEEEARIDLKASPAAKFLLQVMPWELTPSPVTAAKTPAAVPFLWEDVPGKPKPRELPSPFPCLQLPPRLVSVPPSRIAGGAQRNTINPTLSSTQTEGKSTNSPPEKSSNRHRKNNHSWHVLQNLFPVHRHSSQEAAGVVRSSDNPLFRQQIDSPDPKETWKHGQEVSSSSSCSSSSSAFKTWKQGQEVSSSSCSSSSSNTFSNSDGCNTSTKSDSPATVDPLTDADAGEEKFKVDYQLPSPYVATIVPLTSPYRDLGPTDDDDVGSNQKLSRAGSSFGAFVKMFRNGRRWAKSKQKNRHQPATEAWAPTLATYFHRFGQSHDASDRNSCLLDNEERQEESGMVDEKRSESPFNPRISVAMDARCSIDQEQQVSKNRENLGGRTAAGPSTISRPKHRKHRKGRSTRVFGRLRRSSRFFVATYRAIKRALLLRRVNHRKLLGDSQMQYQYLE